MVAIKPSDAEAFVARPNAAQSIILVFGPDAGLAHERAEKLARGAVDNPDDPFSLIRLDGEDLSGNPFRLVEEANTIPMFGGRRAIWVRAGSRNIVAAVEAVIAAPSPDCLVVVEAGDLRKTSPLRTVCERAKNAAAIVCYADSERDIARLVDDEMREAGLTMTPDARAALMPFLGGDRTATRGELRKLALYAHGTGKVTLDDVLAVVADASSIALDDVVDSAFAGKVSDVETNFGKARGAGLAPAGIIGAALRQVAQLHKLRIVVENGGSPSGVVDGARPPFHFRRKPLIETALKSWTASRLVDVMAQLSDAVLETRRQANLGDAVAHRVLIAIAVNARRRG